MTSIDLRCGDWRTALADVVSCDACISDPPYGERTHNGQRHGRRDAAYEGFCGMSARGIPYSCWRPEDVRDFVAAWSPRTRGWLCALTSHDLFAVWADALEGAGRYVFAPIACVQRGMNVRLAGDGPSNWTTWLVVSRPHSMPHWGTLPGAYVGPGGNGLDRGSRPVPGGKPIWLMRCLVRDYSRPGDLICDPCAGGATTLIAAAIEGRRAIGSELDPETFKKAKRRIAAGYTPNMWSEQGELNGKREQGDLDRASRERPRDEGRGRKQGGEL